MKNVKKHLIDIDETSKKAVKLFNAILQKICSSIFKHVIFCKKPCFAFGMILFVEKMTVMPKNHCLETPVPLNLHKTYYRFNSFLFRIYAVVLKNFYHQNKTSYIEGANLLLSLLILMINSNEKYHRLKLDKQASR
ncbi:MAG: hypothetical protein RMX97_23135 [Nostoc sp. DedQUE11]|nr:hypothetical protein [Nostoc sp. DedQUE11]